MTKTSGNGSGATSIHISLQGKGGVGKSLISAILSQYLLSKGQDVQGIDADPVNQTLAEYRGLAVSRLNLLKEGSVDQREFDLLMERFLTESGTFVVDTGASTFIPLWHYVLENQALEYLREKGKRVFIHSVITGGQSLSDTLSGFEQLAETTREKNLVVWLNEYFGPVLLDGAPFREMAVCRRHANKVHGSVAIVRRTADTFGRDVEEMICQKMTFDEALNGNGFTIMAKQRLRVVQRELFDQLDAIPFVQ
jgi:CobQ/CobB/MinD/ParA family nucleotide binding protein